MKTTVQLQAMASADILQYVPPDTLASIKAKDDHPLFRAYCVGEEGDATPRIVGEGSRLLNWLRSAISAMVQKLQFGTKIFLHHGETNAHAGRTVVGVLVGKALEYVAGKMRAVAVAYIYPQYREVRADAASIEAEIDLGPGGRSNTVDGIQVQEITGIAVGDSRNVKPAFAAAGLVAQLQAFEIQNEDKGGKMSDDLTLEKVRDWVLLRRILPGEIFSEEGLKRDKTFQGLLKIEHDVREKLQNDLDTFKTEGTAKVADLEKKNKELLQTVITRKAQTLAKVMIEERKMPPEKAKFITEIKLPQFKVEGDAFDDATIKTQLNEFFDGGIDEYTKLEPVFNPGKTSSKDNGKGNESDQGVDSMIVRV